VIWGADLLREQACSIRTSSRRAVSIFAGRYFGDSLADFIYGKPSAFTQVTPNYVNLTRTFTARMCRTNSK